MAVQTITSHTFAVPLPPAQQKKPLYTDEQIQAISEACRKFLQCDTGSSKKKQSIALKFAVKDIKVSTPFSTLMETLRNTKSFSQQDLETVQKCLKQLLPSTFLVKSKFEHVSTAIRDLVKRELDRADTIESLRTLQQIIHVTSTNGFIDNVQLRGLVRDIIGTFRISRFAHEPEFIVSLVTFIKKIQKEKLKEIQPEIDAFVGFLREIAVDIADKISTVNGSNVEMIRDFFLIAFEAPKLLHGKSLCKGVVNFVFDIIKYNHKTLAFNPEQAKILRYGYEIFKAALKDNQLKIESEDIAYILKFPIYLCSMCHKDTEEGRDPKFYQNLGFELLDLFRTRTPLVKVLVLMELFNCLDLKIPLEEKQKLFSAYVEYLVKNKDINEESIKQLEELKKGSFDKKWLHKLLETIFTSEKIGLEFFFKNRDRLKALFADIYFEFLGHILIHHDIGREIESDYEEELDPKENTNWIQRATSLLSIIDNQTLTMTESKYRLIVDVISMVFVQATNLGCRNSETLKILIPAIESAIKSLYQKGFQDLAIHFVDNARAHGFLPTFEEEHKKFADRCQAIASQEGETNREQRIREVLARIEATLDSDTLLNIDFTNGWSIRQLIELLQETHFLIGYSLFYTTSEIPMEFVKLLKKIIKKAEEKQNGTTILKYVRAFLNSMIVFPSMVRKVYLRIVPMITEQNLSIRKGYTKFLRGKWPHDFNLKLLEVQSQLNIEKELFKKFFSVIGLINSDKILREEFTKQQFDRFFVFSMDCLQIAEKAFDVEVQLVSASKNSEMKLSSGTLERCPLLSSLYELQSQMGVHYPAYKRTYVDQRNKMFSTIHPNVLLMLSRMTHNSRK